MSSAVQAIVPDRWTVPRPFTAGSLEAEMHRNGGASAGRLRALLTEADEIYAQSLAGVAFDPAASRILPFQVRARLASTSQTTAGLNLCRCIDSTCACTLIEAVRIH